MDRYVIREPRAGADYPQGNQVIAFSTNTLGSNNNLITRSDNVYYNRSHGTEISNMQRTPNLGYVGFSFTNSAQPFVQTTSPSNLPPGQGQMVSGIDPRYLTNYSDSNAQYIVTGKEIQRHNSTNNANFCVGYQNQHYLGLDVNSMRMLPQTAVPTEQAMQGQETANNVNFGMNYNNHNFVGPDRTYNAGPPRTETAKVTQLNVYDNKNLISEGKQKYEASHSKPVEKEHTKTSRQNKTKLRWDRLNVLYKRGLLVLFGPVEKVLKWHKSLQDIEVLALYEVVAKCVSVRPGESCAKNLVVRDENGPAMQVVYYEIDFQLPELKLPCTVRVVGKMIAGTCRLQAFKVRSATAEDVAMLPRRAAVSAHHISKLTKEIANI